MSRSWRYSSKPIELPVLPVRLESSKHLCVFRTCCDGRIERPQIHLDSQTYAFPTKQVHQVSKRLTANLFRSEKVYEKLLYLLLILRRGFDNVQAAPINRFGQVK